MGKETKMKWFNLKQSLKKLTKNEEKTLEEKKFKDEFSKKVNL
jgi:hypothetical protein